MYLKRFKIRLNSEFCSSYPSSGCVYLSNKLKVCPYKELFNFVLNFCVLVCKME